MWQRFPPVMRKSMAVALAEAGRRGHEAALPEHLLLAMAREPDCAAVFMLDRAGIGAGRVIAALEPLMQQGTARLQRAARLSPGALHVLDVAAGEADRRGDRHIGTQHVALALTRVNSNLASEVLAKLKFTSAAAEVAYVQWGKVRAPGAGRSWMLVRSPLARKILRPLENAARLPALAWKVFVQKSLGHPRFVTDPYPLYRWLREHEPVRRDPIARVWVLTRYDDALMMMRDPRFKKDPFAVDRLPGTVREQLDAPRQVDSRTDVEIISMLFLDPPEHTRIRAIFTKAFTPKRLEGLRPRIQLICQKRLDRVANAGRMELIADLAAPLPVTVIAELLGFPPEDYQKIKWWSDEMTLALGFRPTPDMHARAAKARMEIREYFDEVVRKVEKAPGENLLSALLAPDVDVLTREELFSNCVLLLAAGHETTTNLIGSGVLSLLRNPDQLRDLQEHPELIDSAVEEMLRYESPGQWNSRLAGEDMELRGQKIERGDVLVASVGAANRDPEVFAEPEKFDIRRKDNRHLAFGAGAHFCLGATLARMEATIAIDALLKRYGNLRLATRRLSWQKGLTFRGLKRLPLIVQKQ